MLHINSLRGSLVIILIVLIVILCVRFFTMHNDSNVELYGYTTDQKEMISSLKTSYLENSRTTISEGFSKYFEHVKYDYEAKEMNLVSVVCNDTDYTYKFVFKVSSNKEKVFIVFGYKFEQGNTTEGTDMTEPEIQSLINKIF